MNKKLIAIAIATAMTAPAMAADLKISGRVNQQFTTLSTDNTAPTADTDVLDYSDNGHQRLQFDVKAGDAYGRFAFDARQGKLGGSGGKGDRDSYIGYKFGASSIQFGRMANSGKNIEKDPLIATFLEVRSAAGASAVGEGNAYDSNGFINDIAQFATKVNGVAIKVQAGLSDNDKADATTAGASNQGHVGISATGKAGGVRWFISQNNGSADEGTTSNDDSILKVGASMKFGKVKAALTLKNVEDNNDEAETIVVRANMGFGNGLTGYAGIGTSTFSSPGNPDVDAGWLRLAVSKKLNKNTTFYGGYTSTDWDAGAGNDTSEIGVGMTIKF